MSPARPAERQNQNRNQVNYNNNNNIPEDNSIDDIERQIAAIERAHARVENGQEPAARLHQNSLESGVSGESGDEEMKEGDDAMFNAIVASLIEYTGQEGAHQSESVRKAEEDEDR